MPSIDVRDLQISFPLYHGTARSLKRTLAAATSGRVQQGPDRKVVVQALRGLSFSLRPGERLGLVGHNGAGKTTLLRALAGIYEPIGGEVVVRGELHTLFDTNSGMQMELTGRENIRLKALYYSLGRAEGRRLEEEVQGFAELGHFIDMPVRTYSSGMVIRLGFALATAVQPKVLLMDEWFLAGDTGFMIKARQRLEELVRQAEILVISTHQPAIIAAWCTRVLWMDRGAIHMQGTPDEVLPAYLGHPVEPEDALVLEA